MRRRLRWSRCRPVPILRRGRRVSGGLPPLSTPDGVFVVNYIQFLNRVIEDGKAGARESYSTRSNHGEGHHKAAKLRGALAGFEACRGKDPMQIRDLYFAANEACEATRAGIEVNGTPAQLDAYWEARCKTLEIEWVANVVSAAMQNEGKDPILAHLPTARGALRASAILGTEKVSS